MEAVHADNDIKRFVGHGQVSHIALNALDVRQAAEPFLGLLEHIRAVIQAGDAGVFQGGPFALREHRSAHRNIQKLARKVVGDVGQDVPCNLVVIRAAPEQLDVQPAEKVSLRENIIVDVFGGFVSGLYFVCHNVYPMVLRGLVKVKR